MMTERISEIYEINGNTVKADVEGEISEREKYGRIPLVIRPFLYKYKKRSVECIRR